MTNEIETKIEKEFNEQLVEMNNLIGRDMNNRPPLYDLEFDKIDEIKQFIFQTIDELLEDKRKKVEGLEVSVCDLDDYLKLVKSENKDLMWDAGFKFGVKQILKILE